MAKMRIVPLGTSAGRPTLARGASALAVAGESSWILCDCGEGAQLAAQRAGFSLSRLDAVLITHLHGDHFNGLPGLLGTLGLEGRSRPLLVSGPPGIKVALRFLMEIGSLGTGQLELRVQEQQGKGGSLQLESWQIETRALEHRIQTYGYRVSMPDRPGTLDVAKADALGIPRGPLLGELKAGRSVKLPDGRVVEPGDLVGPTQRGLSMAYALDTVPCDASIDLGRGVDALVHEATYEHARSELAHQRGHSTGAEAAQIASRAEAKSLVLTHFSPSVDGAEVAKEARSFHPNVIAATDLAEITLG
jgi:ribonuclease Z